MAYIVPWLNSNAPTISALATAGLAFITAYYACSNHNMVKNSVRILQEMQVTRDLTPQPMARVVPGQGGAESAPIFMDLVVTNIGNAPASELEVDATFESQGRKYSRHYKLVDMGVGEERTLSGELSGDPSIQEMQDAMSTATGIANVDITTSYINTFHARFTRRKVFRCDFSQSPPSYRLIKEETTLVPPQRSECCVKNQS